MKKQVHVFYSGRVQGVSFRYTAEDIANEMNVSGWVKNLSDGRVELLAEQEEKILQLFLERIEQFFKDYISSKEINWQPSTGEFTDFSIKF